MITHLMNPSEYRKYLRRYYLSGNNDYFCVRTTASNMKFHEYLIFVDSPHCV